jgi:hypothetical protein
MVYASSMWVTWEQIKLLTYIMCDLDILSVDLDLGTYVLGAVTLTLEHMSLVVTLTLTLVYLGRYVLGRDLDLGTYVLGTYVLGIPREICPWP